MKIFSTVAAALILAVAAEDSLAQTIELMSGKSLAGKLTWFTRTTTKDGKNSTDVHYWCTMAQTFALKD
jgi:hypothetical protein